MITVSHDHPTIALDIFKEVSEWLIEKQEPLWNPCDFENTLFIDSITDGNVYTAFIGNTPVAAMVLQWSDPDLWPNSLKDSGFIHKLSVRRDYAGKGIPQQFIDWAITQVRNRKRSFLRLDCAADRPRLCKIYEDLGFLRVDRRFVGPYDVAFYELPVT